MRCGGLKAAEQATDKDQAIVDSVRADVETKAGKTYGTFKALFAATQVVAGINHFIKVQVDNDECLHLRIYEHFAGTKTLHGVQFGKTLQDELEHF